MAGENQIYASLQSGDGINVRKGRKERQLDKIRRRDSDNSGNSSKKYNIPKIELGQVHKDKEF